MPFLDETFCFNMVLHTCLKGFYLRQAWQNLGITQDLDYLSTLPWQTIRHFIKSDSLENMKPEHHQFLKVLCKKNDEARKEAYNRMVEQKNNVLTELHSSEYEEALNNLSKDRRRTLAKILQDWCNQQNIELFSNDFFKETTVLPINAKAYRTAFNIKLLIFFSQIENNKEDERLAFNEKEKEDRQNIERLLQIITEFDNTKSFNYLLSAHLEEHPHTDLNPAILNFLKNKQIALIFVTSYLKNAPDDEINIARDIKATKFNLEHGLTPIVIIPGILPKALENLSPYVQKIEIIGHWTSKKPSKNTGLTILIEKIAQHLSLTVYPKLDKISILACSLANFQYPDVEINTQDTKRLDKLPPKNFFIDAQVLIKEIPVNSTFENEFNHELIHSPFIGIAKDKMKIYAYLSLTPTMKEEIILDQDILTLLDEINVNKISKSTRQKLISNVHNNLFKNHPSVIVEGKYSELQCQLIKKYPTGLLNKEEKQKLKTFFPAAQTFSYKDFPQEFFISDDYLQLMLPVSTANYGQYLLKILKASVVNTQKMNIKLYVQSITFNSSYNGMTLFSNSHVIVKNNPKNTGPKAITFNT